MDLMKPKDTFDGRLIGRDTCSQIKPSKACEPMFVSARITVRA